MVDNTTHPVATQGVIIKNKELINARKKVILEKQMFPHVVSPKQNTVPHLVSAKPKS